jgi:hypothetical protein
VKSIYASYVEKEAVAMVNSREFTFSSQTSEEYEKLPDAWSLDTELIEVVVNGLSPIYIHKV